ncbi:MAG: hypothetical protein H6748_16285 [Spirochaetaceae bacterium]|nr:hypothetical protein [Spirochaetaceae bacterium]
MPISKLVPPSVRLVALLLVCGGLVVASVTRADSVLEQWRSGLSGARLTAYSGSVISSNSSLTTLTLCRSGRFHLDRDASWSVPGQAGGASRGVVTGRWGVESAGGGIVVTYETDEGERGAYPVYLQANGRVNLGGVAYATERGAAGC